MATPTWEATEVGAAIPAARYPVTRATLVMYAGASGDFNVIHWNERVATSVGLPSVIAHGMFTMALAGRLLTDWAGDPGAVRDIAVRFTRPVVVPDDDIGALVEVSATVTDKLDGGLVKVAITATSGGQTVLAKATALIRLP